MQNAKIFILLLARGGTSVLGEEGRSALGLYAKYDKRVVNGVTQAVELLDCSTKGKRRTVNESLVEAKDRQITLADGDRVGFYLVGHAQSYDTLKPARVITELIAERVKAAPKVEDLSSGKKKERAIQVTVDKVCLVLCDSAERRTGKPGVVKSSDQPIVVVKADEAKRDYKKRLEADVKEYGLETSLLAELCRRLAEEGHRPRVAGYVGAITVVGPSDVDERGHTRGGFKDQLAVGQKTHNYDDTGRKLYFVYEPERGYVERDSAMWADTR